MKQYYELKVTLVDTDPSVWRTFLVEPDVTFNELHQVLQAVMGWTSSHFYSFRKEMVVIAPPSRHDPIDSTSTDLDASKIHLSELLKRKGESIEYTYDFGDNWEHMVELKDIVEHEDIHMATCLEGERACPPEDSGGIPGYTELVSVMQDPDCEEYDEMVEWLGEPFDPEHFDINQVNADLERLSAKNAKTHTVKIIPKPPVVQKKPGLKGLKIFQSVKSKKKKKKK
jgi:hypothetical protein